jgi:hypothetical protein
MTNGLSGPYYFYLEIIWADINTEAFLCQMYTVQTFLLPRKKV